MTRRRAAALAPAHVVKRLDQDLVGGDGPAHAVGSNTPFANTRVHAPCTKTYVDREPGAAPEAVMERGDGLRSGWVEFLGGVGDGDAVDA
jgi:hypothetical protein